MEADLTVRGACVAGICQIDLAEIGTHAQMLASAWRQLGTVDSAIIAYGVLGDQKDAEHE